MIFKNMGLFWKREDIFWGKGSNPGELWGVWNRAKSGDWVDIWDQVGIYALYSNFDLVYVGQAGRGLNARLGHRLRRHTRDKLALRWDTFSWFGLRSVNANGSLGVLPGKGRAPVTSILDLLEGMLIEVGEPPLNRQGGRLKGVKLFLQRRDERLNSVDDQIVEIKKDIRRLTRASK